MCSDKKQFIAGEKCSKTSAPSINKCVRHRVDIVGTMAEREDNVYKAKLAEQAERYDGKRETRDRDDATSASGGRTVRLRKACISYG